MAIDCYGTLEAWKNDISLKDFVATHDCYCPSANSSPVCTPKSRNSYTPSFPSKGLTTNQQIQLMMIQGILQPILNSFFQSALTPKYYGPTPDELKKWEEEKLKKEAQERFEILSNWNKLTKQSSKGVVISKDRNKRIASLMVVDINKDSEEKREEDKKNKVFDDALSIFGNVVMDKTIEKAEDMGKDVIEKLSEKYGKEWGSKVYEQGLPIMKILVAGAQEGKESAGVETINYVVSWLCKPMTSIQSGVSDIGRKIYTKIAFSSADKFLEETEKAGNTLGFDFSGDQFMKDFENSLTNTQKIFYRYLRGE